MKTMGTMVLELTKEEKRAFAIVDKILKTMQDQGEEYRVMNLETGECVEFSEIARVRGILGCFENGGKYEVTKVGKPKCEDACRCGHCKECEDDLLWGKYEEEAIAKYLVDKLFGF